MKPKKFRNFKAQFNENFPYANKLSTEDREWLVQFAKEESGYFEKETPPIHNEEQRNQIDNSRNAYRRDIMNKCPTVPYLEEGEDE
jgi:hypothetical protein